MRDVGRQREDCVTLLCDSRDSSSSKRVEELTNPILTCLSTRRHGERNHDTPRRTRPGTTPPLVTRVYVHTVTWALVRTSKGPRDGWGWVFPGVQWVTLRTPVCVPVKGRKQLIPGVVNNTLHLMTPLFDLCTFDSNF